VSKARLVITAVVVEGRRQADVAREYRVSKGWVSKLVARYRAEGDAAFEPRSRRPHSSPSQTPGTTVGLIVAIRDRLVAEGHDAGADTIVWHLAHDHHITVSRLTVHRVLTRHGRITPAPRKRPRSSYVRFQAEMPNETWQADFTHWRLADGRDVEILCWLDDHSRYALSVTAHRRVTGPIVTTAFVDAVEHHGPPASTLTDNGMVFTTRLAGGPGGRNGHRARGGSVQPAATPQLPGRSHPHRRLPRPTHSHPTANPHAHYRVRHDRVSHGNVTLRVGSVLHHIGVGRHLHGTPIIMLIDDLDVRVIDATTGEIYRHLTIDPTRRYHGTGAPIGGPRRPYGPRKTKPAEP
jgi:hypothetical protein